MRKPHVRALLRLAEDEGGPLYTSTMRISQTDLKAYGPLLTPRTSETGEYPVVRDEQVSVHRLGLLWRQGVGPREIVDEHYPHLRLDEVFAALSCFCANEARFIAALAAEDEEAVVVSASV